MPVRRPWQCQTCAQPWPCAAYRSTLQLQDPLKKALAVVLLTHFAGDAMRDLADVPGSPTPVEIIARFLWFIDLTDAEAMHLVEQLGM